MDITITDALVWTLLGLSSIAVLVLIVVLSRLVSTLKRAETTMREVDTTLVEMRTAVVPLVGKAQITIDAVNAELLRIDGIITTFEEATDRVASTSEAVTDMVSAPMDIVTGFAQRVRKSWKEKRAESHAASSAE